MGIEITAAPVRLGEAQSTRAAVVMIAYDLQSRCRNHNEWVLGVEP